jgi:hypothetical protein
MRARHRPAARHPRCRRPCRRPASGRGLGCAPDLGGAVLVADADDRNARALRQLDQRRDAALPHPSSFFEQLYKQLYTLSIGPAAAREEGGAARVTQRVTRARAVGSARTASPADMPSTSSMIRTFPRRAHTTGQVPEAGPRDRSGSRGGPARPVRFQSGPMKAQCPRRGRGARRAGGGAQASAGPRRRPERSWVGRRT